MTVTAFTVVLTLVRNMSVHRSDHVSTNFDDENNNNSDVSIIYLHITNIARGRLLQCEGVYSHIHLY